MGPRVSVAGLLACLNSAPLDPSGEAAAAGEMGVHMRDPGIRKEALDQGDHLIALPHLRVDDQRLAVIGAEGQEPIPQDRRQFAMIGARLGQAHEDRAAGPVGRGRIWLVDVVEQQELLADRRPFQETRQG